MVRCLSLLVLFSLSSLSCAEDRLPTPNYQKQPSDPAWLAPVVQIHGHLGPSIVVGARMGMIGLRAVDAKGYFDVEVTCEGPLMKPPYSCFLDGMQVATGATMGKRTLFWAQAEKLVVEFKNTKTGKMAEVRPTAALLELFPLPEPEVESEAKPKTKPETHPSGGPPDHEHLEALARKIAAMPDKEIAEVKMVEKKDKEKEKEQK
jgi:formylmethanofuran dehydrogenase subunit E